MPDLSTLGYPGRENGSLGVWGEEEEEEGGVGVGVGGGRPPPAANWWGLVALLVVLLTLFGNILLILAISWDRRLQNMTNYFLLSLAVTDLMVASLVMPLSIVVLILGHFPFSSELCLLWISLDVLFCTASIMHLCTLSVDRFLSLRYPMKFGRHKTRRRVVLKIVLVWCLSLAASLPLSLMYATDPHSTIVDGVCQIPVSLFQIIGSVICFYIPLFIMLATYALTARLLSKKQNELQSNVREAASASASAASASPSPRSIRWKKLLCKTTSNLSTSTAVSLADGDLSDSGGCSSGRLDAAAAGGGGGGDRGGCGGEGKLRRFGSSPLRRRPPPLLRYTSHHYRAALLRGGTPPRGYAAKGDASGGGVIVVEERLFPRGLPASPAAAYELSVFPQGPSSAPTSAAASPLRRRHRRGKDAEAQPKPEDGRGEPQGPSCEQNGDPRRRRRRDEEESAGGGREEEEEEEEEGGGGGGGNSGSSSSHVAVPCSCAPRFFLEDIKSSSESQCEECTEPRPHQVEAPYRRRSQEESSSSSSRHRHERRPKDAARMGCCPCLKRRLVLRRQNGSQGAEVPLSSPWHEGSSPPRNTPDLVTRTALRSSGGQVTTLLQKAGSTESSAVPSSSKGLWRQRSCSASIKYVSSKRHGRNIRMEQKATKVLGVVFFTFVLLWAPFFIANVLISCGAHIEGEMINLVTWLGYASSMVNPFFYTFFNKTFRQTFLKIMKCQMRSGRKYHL